MNNLKYIFPMMAVLFLSSCLGGDKKIINVEELGDTSFVNKNFSGNRINYEKGMSGCDNISKEAIAKLYSIGADLVHIEDPTKSDRYKDPEPGCMFYIETGDNDYMWLRGSIMVQREVEKDEYMGEIAEAVGAGTDWEEAWSLKKSISSSSEWIPNMGQAALWNAKKVMLEIKFEGYTLVVNPLKNILNVEDAQKERDYKQIAVDMAKAAGYIN